jgi:hypothetical protein
MTTNKALVKLFFRLYAWNCRRSWRNNPTDAWSDAIYTMDVLIGLPVLSLIMTVWAIAIHQFPKTIGTVGMPKVAELLVVLFVGIVVDMIFTKSINKYRNHPVNHDSFSATTDRVAIVRAFLVSFSLFIAMLGIVVMLNRRN